MVMSRCLVAVSVFSAYDTILFRFSCRCFPPWVLSVLTFKVHQDFDLGPSTIPALSKVPGRRARPRTLDHARCGIEFLCIASWSNVRARPSVFDICPYWQISDILGWGIFDPGEARKEKRKGKGEGRKKKKEKKKKEEGTTTKYTMIHQIT